MELSAIKVIAFDTGGTVLDWHGGLSSAMAEPLPDAYRRAAGFLGAPPGEILMVACHNFDLDAARGVGYRTAFVRRPDEWGRPDRRIRCRIPQPASSSTVLPGWPSVSAPDHEATGARGGRDVWAGPQINGCWRACGIRAIFHRQRPTS
jgi:hypothetical protein